MSKVITTEAYTIRKGDTIQGFQNGVRYFFKNPKCPLLFYSLDPNLKRTDGTMYQKVKVIIYWD